MISFFLQGSAKEWTLGCVKRASADRRPGRGNHATLGPILSRSLYLKGFWKDYRRDFGVELMSHSAKCMQSFTNYSGPKKALSGLRDPAS